MKTTKKDKQEKPRLCFKVTVDGKTWGPFLDKHRHQYKRLEHKAGVVIKNLWLAAGWVEPPPAPIAKKDKSLPLLEGVGFIAVPKR